MTTQPEAVPESLLRSQSIASSTASQTRPMYWSVRRELWENRSIYLAPSLVAGAFLVGSLVDLIHQRVRGAALFGSDPVRQLRALEGPYSMAAAVIMATTFIVGIFYCLETLQSERRDRSILFWKSLPVSDLTVVLAKATIPIVILPLLTFAFIVTTQLMMLVLSAPVLMGSGISVVALWSHLSFFQMSAMLLYHLVTVHAIWNAPIYAWLLMVSAWARRVAFLWAVLPLLAISVLEKLIFNTWHFAGMLARRFAGPEAYSLNLQGNLPMDPLTAVSALRFLTAPGLWIGLTVTAIFIVAAARIRRDRGSM